MRTIDLILNGKPSQFPADQTVADLVVSLGLPGPGRGVAVAVDGEVVHHDAWTVTPLASGHRVEVLIASQGG